MTFQMLLTSGRDIVDVLIKRLIDLYICDSAATDAISGRLRDVCPSLYSCGDELYSKATFATLLSLKPYKSFCKPKSFCCWCIY